MISTKTDAHVHDHAIATTAHLAEDTLLVKTCVKAIVCMRGIDADHALLKSFKNLRQVVLKKATDTACPSTNEQATHMIIKATRAIEFHLHTEGV